MNTKKNKSDCRKFQTLYNEKLDYEDSLKSEFDNLKAEYEQDFNIFGSSFFLVNISIAKKEHYC